MPLTLRMAVLIPCLLIAPLAANQPIGELTITDLSGEVVSRVPLTPGKAVPEAGLWTRATDSVRLWFN